MGRPLDQNFGADERNRTSTGLLPQASETCASTSSATSAGTARILAKNAAGDKRAQKLFKVARRQRLATHPYAVLRKLGKPTPAASKPPSTARICPLIKLAASLHKNATALAISSTVP